MGASKRKSIKQLRREAAQRNTGRLREVKSDDGRVIGWSVQGIHERASVTGKVLSSARQYSDRYGRLLTGVIKPEDKVLVGAIKGAFLSASDNRNVHVVIAEKRSSKAQAEAEYYADPFLFELGIFSDKEDYNASTDAFVAKVKSGEIQPRQREPEGEL